MYSGFTIKEHRVAMVLIGIIFIGLIAQQYKNSPRVTGVKVLQDEEAVKFLEDESKKNTQTTKNSGISRISIISE